MPRHELKRKRKQKAPNKPQASSEDEDEGISGDDSSHEELPRSRQRSSRRGGASTSEQQHLAFPSRRRKARHEEAKESSRYDDDSSLDLPLSRNQDDDEDFALEDSSSEDEAVAGEKKKKTTPRRRKSAIHDSSSGSSGSEDLLVQRRTSARRRRGTPSRRATLNESNVDAHSVDGAESPTRRKSPRNSPHKTYKEENDEDSDVPKRAKKRRLAEEEEEFRLEKNSSSSSSEDDIHELEGEDVWSEEGENEDDGEEELEDKKAKPIFSQDSDEESIASQDAPSNKPPACTSTHDAITEEKLPVKHICYFPPDQNSRQCFSLETLRKIALTAGHPKYRSSNFGANQQTFLQPPHFRSAMNDDLLDQIASRFGREALDLHGSYYRRDRAGLEDTIAPVAEHEDIADEDFLQQMNDYVQGSMQNQDLYVCPLCYTVAHKRLVNWNSTSIASDAGLPEEQLLDVYSTDYSADPIRILGSLDHEQFYIAGMFCFRKIAMVKKHLREDHDVDTKVVDGNDLYNKYKIRATDGLLQRYLNSGQRRYRKSMQSYWYKDAHSYDFCYLVTLVRQAEQYRLNAQDHVQSDQHEEDSDNGPPDFVAPATEYFRSIAELNEKLWDIVVAPYRKYDEAQDDFFDDDEVLDDGEGALHRAAFHDPEALRESADEAEEMARAIQQRYQEDLPDEEGETVDEKEKDEYEDELVTSIKNGNDLQDTSSEDEDSDEKECREGMAEQSSSEEDEWERNIQVKRRGSIGKRRQKTPVRGHRRRQRTNAPDAPSESARKRRIIDESSDEE